MSKKLKFYTDEHVPSSVVKGLRIRGVEILTTNDSGMIGESDENQIAFAKKEEMVIFTQDEDFLRLHAKGVEHSGIIYAHQRTPIGKMVQGLMLIYQVLEFKEMENHIEFL